jgi:hypothetical protein
MVQYRFSVSPEPPLVQRGEGFSLEIGNLPFAEEVTHVWVDLGRVEWEDTSWCWNSGVTPLLHNGALRLRFGRLDLDTGIYLVPRLRFSLDAVPSPSSVIDARPTINFPRTFVQVTDQPVRPVEPAKLGERLVMIDGRWRGPQARDPANPESTVSAWLCDALLLRSRMRPVN